MARADVRGPLTRQVVQRTIPGFPEPRVGQNLKYRPLAFTEHGAVMAASVLNSAKAVSMSVFVVRAFLRLRAWVTMQADLAAQLAELERRVGSHDRELRDIILAIRALIQPPDGTPRKRIGFRV
jgi:hypothetical protein